MRNTLRACLIALSAVASIGPSRQGHAALMLNAQLGPGVSASNIHSGDVFEIDIVATGSPGEHITQGGGGSTSYNNLQLVGAVQLSGSTLTNDLLTSPLIYYLNVEAIAAGPATFSATILPFNTNVAAYPAMPLALRLNILPTVTAVPEPAAWALVMPALIMAMLLGRRRHGRAIEV